MFNVGNLACPYCAEVALYINCATDLSEHPDVLAKLREENRQAHANCVFHLDKEAERLCSVHLLPL